jgi:ABC-type enterobactin transport system permease subunit
MILDANVQAVVAARQRVDDCRRELDTARLALMWLAGQLATAEYRAAAATQAMAEAVIHLREVEKR